MDISFAIIISAIVAVVCWAAREFARLAQVAQTEKRVGYTKVLEVLFNPQDAEALNTGPSQQLLLGLL